MSPAAPARLLHRVEEALLVAALLAAMALPLIDVVGRPLGGFHIPGGAPYLQQITLWLAFLGGLLATREGQHLTLSTAELFEEGRWRRAAALVAGSVAAAVAAVLAYGAWQVVLADREQGKILPGGLPEWVSECVMPVALGLIALRFAWRASESWRTRPVALAAAGGAFGLGALGSFAAALAWPLALLILAAALLGAPVFTAMGGLALVLFYKDGVPVSAVPAEIYRLIASPTLPAIPLLTACGYILAESRASSRLVRFFRALFGWMPGGVAVMVAAVCALFTTFTGGSGVTIIALGGLVYPMLREEGYSEGFSLGLVTAAGSLGLLFPPSLPVILYSVVAGSREMSAPADQLYLAGLLPGLLLVVLVALYGVWVGAKSDALRASASPGGSLAARPGRRSGSSSCRWSWWRCSSPGSRAWSRPPPRRSCTPSLVECALTRDLHPVRGIPQALVKSSILTGAVLILLASALGLTSYLVDAQIPDQLLSWVTTHIESQLLFLLALNLILLVLGSVLEIYSAIIILAPLVVPLGLAFGVDPIHLGIIFLANLELGFLFPPVGLNLFLSSSRFGKRLPELYRHVLPFLAILGIGVLLITYVPALSLGVLRLLGMR